MNDKNNIKLNKIKKKYVSEEKLIIAKVARKTLRYIEKNTENFPTKYVVLRNKIINTCYDILEYIYRANVFQELNDKKEIVVKIQILNFYLEEAYNKGLLTDKKFINYGNYLLELDKMVRAWFSYETSKQFI